MGSGSSILGFNKNNDSPEILSNCKTNKGTHSLEKKENAVIPNDENDLTSLPKEILIAKVINLQMTLNELEKKIENSKKNNENQENKMVIPRSLFSTLDSIGPETIKAKDILISQLERELRAQTKLFETQKLQSKKKIEKYAAEITELRIKSNQHIIQLENELINKNCSNDNRGLNSDTTSPLILKLSQKVNEQADIIKELQLSLCRKDEIIEGFKLFEANQNKQLYEKSTKNNEKKLLNSHLSSNTHSFVSKEMIALESNRIMRNLSLSEESCFSEERLTPINRCDSLNNGRLSNKSRHLSLKSSIKEEAKNLVRLPTNLITNSPKISNSPDI